MSTGRSTPWGDSGIYLRGSPQVQIWDPSLEVAGGVGSGGLYNNQENPSKPSAVADKPVGEWNTFHIKMVGEKVWVTLNGKLVVDNVTMENYWERDKPIYPTGQIEFAAPRQHDLLQEHLYQGVAGVSAQVRRMMRQLSPPAPSRRPPLIAAVALAACLSGIGLLSCAQQPAASGGRRCGFDSAGFRDHAGVFSG